MKKIRAVKFYQSITFDKRQETFISKELPKFEASKLELSIDKDILCIHIKSTTDEILVPLTNVVGIYFDNAHSEERKKEKELESKRETTPTNVVKVRSRAK